jgi:putative glycosyltransferase (TIGR04348 family)
VNILIVTPASKGSRSGNRVTALRWAKMLRELGHAVRIKNDLDGRADVLIALHAKRSASAVRNFEGGRVVVALTGTDLYRDLPKVVAAQRSLDTADAIIALQAKALDRLRPRWRDKTFVVLQSVTTPPSKPAPRTRTFDVCVVGHLRDVKDPMRPAYAARTLPSASRIAVLQVGRAMSPRYERLANSEMARNNRYQWLGERPRWQTRRIIGRSQLLVLPSLMEGGAHVIAEALVAGTPVLASAIDGSIGQLGDGYPGYFDVRDTAGLSALMLRAEREPRFYASLARWCKRLAPKFSPAHERRALRRLIDQLD